jgi:hypothetical protein
METAANGTRRNYLLPRSPRGNAPVDLKVTCIKDQSATSG